ncbi:junctional adhesion molecule 2A isoform X2 [Clupea harengus]|uniref:Junctional adhesion molecule 2A isoform X2 n=1 Tax=Clupea harengus TaxID=7950 RepID=A0A6P3VL69_CLUHA|nr:junctional adhesion molecule 2A isoform X2 [Clupea harengus]
MENLSTFPFVFVILLQILPSAPVTVFTTAPIVEVRESQAASLSCEFKTEKDEQPRIEWKKTRGTSSSSPDFVYFGEEFRKNFKGRASMRGATVVLEGVTQEDAGEYRCEVSAALDNVQLGEANITLIVLVPPQIPLCEIPSRALTGAAVEMRCREHHGVPAATYTWYKDKKALHLSPVNSTYTLNPRTGVLMFTSVTKTDTGQYHCEARNKAGPPKSCEGIHMKIDDLNVPAIIGGVVVVCLVIALCTFGAFYAHRHGFFSKHRGRNTRYSPPPEEKQQDFKHTHSFML